MGLSPWPISVTEIREELLTPRSRVSLRCYLIKALGVRREKRGQDLLPVRLQARIAGAGIDQVSLRVAQRKVDALAGCTFALFVLVGVEEDGVPVRVARRPANTVSGTLDATSRWSDLSGQVVAFLFGRCCVPAVSKRKTHRGARDTRRLFFFRVLMENFDKPAGCSWLERRCGCGAEVARESGWRWASCCSSAMGWGFRPLGLLRRWS